MRKGLLGLADWFIFRNYKPTSIVSRSTPHTTRYNNIQNMYGIRRTICGRPDCVRQRKHEKLNIEKSINNAAKKCLLFVFPPWRLFMDPNVGLVAFSRRNKSRRTVVVFVASVSVCENINIIKCLPRRRE